MNFRKTQNSVEYLGKILNPIFVTKKSNKIVNLLKVQFFRTNNIVLPAYKLNILTHGNGVMTPFMKLRKFVMDVTVIETAASR